MEYWEVRQDGLRYCHCGSLRDAEALVCMDPHRRTLHLVRANLEQETVSVEAVSLGHELQLEPQKILPESDLELLSL